MDNVKTTRRFRPALVTALLILGFGALSVFSPFLHSHEFDLAHVEKACVSCQWAQSHMGFDVQLPDLTVSWLFQTPLLVCENIFLKELAFPFSSRGPPFLS